MRLVNNVLLSEFRQKPNCENCGRPAGGNGLEPHHIFSRGAGRVDIPINLVALCRACHNGFHYSGKPSRDDLLTIVALREGIIAEDVEKEVYRIRLLPKPQEAAQEARQHVPMPKRVYKPSSWKTLLEKRKATDKEFRRQLKLRRKESKPKNRGMS